MTIKTVHHQASSLIIKISKSDMQKRGAVKNLFGTTVDRHELRQQLDRINDENNQTLQNYKVESIISVIGHSANNRPRKKRSPISLESEDESDGKPQKKASTRQPISNDDEPSSSSSPPPSSSSSATPLQTSSMKKSDVKLIQQKVPLPKGQKTLKGKKPTKHFRKLSSY